MTLVQSLLFLLPASLVLALEKITFFGFPIYSLELIFLFFVGVSLWQINKGEDRLLLKNLDRWLALGAGLFVGGALLSLLTHPFTTTTLGQFKSWFLFPAATFITLYILRGGEYKERLQVYAAWLVGVGVIVLAALYGYSQDIVTYDQRLAFPYSSANFLAYLLVPGVLLGAFFLSRSKEAQKRNILIGIFGTMLFVVYLTHSYTVWLALIITLPLLMYVLALSNHKYLSKLIIQLCIVMTLLCMLIWLEQGNTKWQNLFLNDGRSSLDSRLMIWHSASAIIKDHWFLGIGVGNFQKEYLAYQIQFPTYLEWAVPQPHNILLATWLQTGLLGLLGAGLLLGRTFFLLIQKIYRNKNKEIHNEGFLLLSLWGAFFIYGLFDTPYFRNDLAFIFWLQILLTSWYVKGKITN